MLPEEIPLMDTSPYKTREVYKEKPLALIYVISSRFNRVAARKEDFTATGPEPEALPGSQTVCSPLRLCSLD
jgi:hypothetical protein